MFSLPMLFFMGAASHLPFAMSETSKLGLFWAGFAVIWAALQANAVRGKEGPIQTLKGVVTAGFVLTAVVYVWLEICIALLA